MKNNRLIFILLPAVLAVWAIIGYRVVNYIRHDTPAQIENIKKDLEFKPDSLSEDKFEIIANYRDPFLDFVPLESKPLIRPVKVITPKPLIIPHINWPIIKFKGLVKNHELQKSYGLITIDGKLKSVLAKNEINGGWIITP